MLKWINLAIGGVLGTYARYLLGGAVYQITGTAFPYGTLLVNLLGCFTIGFLATLAEDKFLLGPNGRILFMVGFCGAFTTFSTYLLETNNLLKDGEMSRAFLNFIASNLIGFIALKLGISLGELL